MAVRTTITNKGLQLLASSSQATGQYYWLGYYGLAYVPDFWKTDTSIEFPDPECFQVNTGTPVDASDIDPVTPNMQRLTTYGDMIWNVWQGDLTGTGFIDGSDGTPGGNLFGLTMYGQNVKKHYRYVLDENGNNVLVSWINDPTSTVGDMLKQTTYIGTDGFIQSEMPIPSPLYYLGDVTGMNSVTDFFPDFADSEENGSNIYPFIEVDSASSGNITVPKVSSDFRGYLDTLGNGINAPYAPTAPGAQFDSIEIPPAVDLSFDVTGWYAGDLTYTIPESTATLNNNPAKFDTEFWKLHTISNFNRWHAPVDNIGFITDSNLSNRNMAKTTKFFPISNYKTINTDSGFTANGEATEVATAIQLTIDLDLSPSTLNDGDESSQITYFDKYENSDPDPSQSPKDQYGKSIYTTTHSSIKFNRIGIYAVPLRKHPCAQDQGFGQVPATSSSCSDVAGSAVELQFQINPDDEPVLFAVMDWDNTVTLDDSGNGISSFRAEVNVNLESPDGVEETSLIRDSAIFYNLYEDDALKWYQNQLIANAQTQNAITELGLEIAGIKNQGEGDCCPAPDLSELYAAKNHTHTGLGIRNLKDANNAVENGLRGIATLIEGVDINGFVYKLGFQSVSLGLDTAVMSDNSTIAGGANNLIFQNDSYTSLGSFIGSGVQNSINALNQTTNHASILGGSTNSITDSSYASILGGVQNIVIASERSTVVGTQHTVTSSTSSGVYSGSIHEITSSADSGIFAGAGHSITDSSYSSIIGGASNIINNNTNGHNTIVGSVSSSILNNSSRSGVYSSAGSFLTESSDSSVISSTISNINNGNQTAIIASNDIQLIKTGPVLDINNVAAVARVTPITNPIDATVYTDNINFIGNLTANGTNGVDGDVLTKVGGVPVWTESSGGSFEWQDWPVPTTNIPSEIIINPATWTVQYAIVNDMVFLRGQADLTPISDSWNLTLDTALPSGVSPSTTRVFSLYDYCVGVGINARITSSTLSVGGFKKYGDNLRTTQESIGFSSVNSVTSGTPSDTFNGLMSVGTGDIIVADPSLYSVGTIVDVSAGAGTLDTNLPAGSYTVSAINASTITLIGVSAAGDGSGTCALVISNVKSFKLNVTDSPKFSNTYAPRVGSIVKIASGSDIMVGNYIDVSGDGSPSTPYIITVNVTYSSSSVTASDWFLTLNSQGISGKTDGFLISPAFGSNRTISFNGCWYPL